MKTVFLLFLSIISLFAQTFVYECSENKHFVIQLLNEKAKLVTSGETVLLNQNPAASAGVQYTAEGYSFVQEGYEASLQTPERQYRRCSNNRYKASWEDAKLRGYNFRAIGNEPGWYLEITHNGKQSILVTDYGQEKYELHLPSPYASSDNRTKRYRIDGFLDIRIDERGCRDTMTGKYYPSRVKLVIDEKSYTGCGKVLD